MRTGLFLLAVAPLWAADGTAPLPALTGEEIFERLVEHNRSRELLMRGYSVERTYSAQNESGKKYAVEVVRMEFTAAGEKTFRLVSGSGSWMVRNLVFTRLRETETVAARGGDRKDSSIAPANYRLTPEGIEDIGGRPCYVVRAIPLHKNKYLFEGRIWVDAEDFAVARIEGHPAANPSFWTQRIEFVRAYGKYGNFWLPTKDYTVAHIRFYGRKILDIEHYDYVLRATPLTAVRVE